MGWKWYGGLEGLYSTLYVCYIGKYMIEKQVYRKIYQSFVLSCNSIISPRKSGTAKKRFQKILAKSVRNLLERQETHIHHSLVYSNFFNKPFLGGS